VVLEAEVAEVVLLILLDDVVMEFSDHLAEKSVISGMQIMML
jgi:hypothetical protein